MVILIIVASALKSHLCIIIKSLKSLNLIDDRVLHAMIAIFVPKYVLRHTHDFEFDVSFNLSYSTVHMK